MAIGANLPGPDGATPLETCRWALGEMARMPGLRLVAHAAWYRSPAWPPSDQPDYINGAARLAGVVEPAELLAALHAIEARAGRRRSVANAARSLDLDLIAIGGLVRRDTPPLLPHPRAHQRDFVLLPLADIAGEWRHPLEAATTREMLARLPPPAAHKVAM